jgi:tetratricopeptide (TPR) repeat protein
MLTRLTVLLLFVTGSLAAQLRPLLEEAEREIASADHARVVALIDSITHYRAELSPTLYLALGNAHFELGQYGRAVLAYERGLRLNPTDRDLQNNLRYVREEAGILSTPANTFFLLRWWHGLGSLIGTATAFYLGIFFLWLAVAGVVYWLLFRSRMKEKRRFALLPLGGGALVLAGICFALGTTRYQQLIRVDEAILLTEGAPLRVSPTADSSVEATLGEGVRLTITDELEAYVKVRLEDGRQGYLRRDELAVI